MAGQTARGGATRPGRCTTLRRSVRRTAERQSAASAPILTASRGSERISASSRSSAEEAIAWAIETFPRLGFAVSFQKTSSVIIDIAHRIDPEARFFYLDTELLFAETYDTRDALAERYGIEFERFAQDNPPGLRERWEAQLWRESTSAARPERSRPCARALEGVDCWVSGFAGSTPETRAGAPHSAGTSGSTAGS